MPNGLMNQKAPTPMTAPQQQLVQELEEMAQKLKATADDTTLSPEKKENLVKKGLTDLRAKRGELAADLFETHALASGTSPQRLELVQGVRALRDSLHQVARDPRLTAEQRRTIIDSHANYLRQRMRELGSADVAPTSGLEAVKDLPAQIGNRLNELSGSLRNLPAFARQQLDQWRRPQKAGPNSQAPGVPATEAVEPFLF